MALAAIATLALLLGWSATRSGRQRLRRYTAMGSMLLGLGMVMDPPTQHAAEATQRRVSKDDTSGDPADPEIDPPS